MLFIFMNYDIIYIDNIFINKQSCNITNFDSILLLDIHCYLRDAYNMGRWLVSCGFSIIAKF